jgi:mitochondrial fission protein ELM1
MKITAPDASVPRDVAARAQPQRVWLLIDDRPGHRTQVVGLARLLGLEAAEKRLAFRAINWLPNRVLGATLVTLDRDASDRLDAPFPDLAIGMGRRVVPVARWLRHASGGATRIVLLGRKAANDMRGIDLGIACAHFGLMQNPRLIEVVVPPTQVDATLLAEAAVARPDPLAGSRKPRIVLLVGGPTVLHRFDATIAEAMARAVAAATDALGGSLAIVTSRRTPDDAIDAIGRAAPDAHLHLWQKDRADNPYLSYLAGADLLVVTGESESMLAEASATGRPLTIYPLPPRPERLKERIGGRLRSWSGKPGALGAIGRSLLGGGWLTPPRDVDRLHTEMVEHRLAARFDGAINTQAPDRRDDIGRVRERVAALLATGSVASR